MSYSKRCQNREYVHHLRIALTLTCDSGFLLLNEFTSDDHDDDGEDLLGPGVGRDVAESDGGERGAGVVQGGHVGVGVRDAAAVRQRHLLRQQVQPT